MFRQLVHIMLIIVSCSGINLRAQSDSLQEIDKITNRIDLDSTLSSKEFDASEIYKQGFDGGGFIEIRFDDKGIKKIRQEIGVSYGRLTTIIYFDDGKPVKIIDKEENFKWREDQTGWDYSEINQVFRADIFIFDWETDNTKTKKQGQRNLSEGTCTIFEYEPLISRGKELMKK